MRVAILGAGAMGSWFGGRLAQVGVNVQLLTTNEAHRLSVQKSGLMLRSGAESQSVNIPIHPPEEIAGPVDLILLFTKTFQSTSALALVEHAINEQTCVLTLQNGLGNSELISSFLPLERVLVGVTMMPVDMPSPGVVEKKGEGVSYFNSVSGQNPAIHQSILAAFEPTDIEIVLDRNIHERIWSKVAFNAGMNAFCALAHGTPGTIGASEGARDLVKKVADEVAYVADATGVKVNLEKVYSMIDFACENHQQHKPSMLQDLLARRRTEVDALNGAVVAQAEKAGVKAPLNSTLKTLVKLSELSHQLVP